MSYPPPPPVPGLPSKKPRLRGHTGIRVGAILSILGLAVAVVGVIVLGTQSLGKVNDFQRIKIADGSGTVRFSGTGQFVAYYEAPNVTSNITRLPPIELAVRNQSTKTVVAITPYGNRSDGKIKKLTYDYNGHHGAALAQFQIPTAGTYEVGVQGGTGVAPDADLAFGRSIEKGTIVGSLLTGAGVLALIIGLAVLIVGLVRRRNHKNRVRAGTEYPAGGAPSGYPPGYGQPQQGYPPGYPPQQGYPPQPDSPQHSYPPPAYPPQPDYPQQSYPPQRENPWPPADQPPQPG